MLCPTPASSIRSPFSSRAFSQFFQTSHANEANGSGSDLEPFSGLFATESGGDSKNNISDQLSAPRSSCLNCLTNHLLAFALPEKMARRFFVSSQTNFPLRLA